MPKAKQYPKGRRSKPVKAGKLKRKTTTAPKTARRTTRKQKDVSTAGGRRKVAKNPRRVPRSEKTHRKEPRRIPEGF
jgi:hypothetical protein